MKNRFWSWRGSGRATRRALPPGVDEVRLLTTPPAEILAQLSTTLAILDQSVDAMRLLIARRRKSEGDPLGDLALLQFSLTQFVSCFKARRAPHRLTAKQAFDAAGARHFEHVAALADQLSGARPRLTGQTEVVVLLKRAGGRVGVVGLATRRRSPDRLTVQELSGIADFMTRGREAYASLANAHREQLLADVHAMGNEELLALDRAADHE